MLVHQETAARESAKQYRSEWVEAGRHVSAERLIVRLIQDETVRSLSQNLRFEGLSTQVPGQPEQWISADPGLLAYTKDKKSIALQAAG